MKLSQSEIKKIAVFRALQLGDMLCAIPAIRALRHAYPNAQITLIGLPWGQSFTERFSKYFDNFIEFPGFPGLPERPFNPAAFTSFLAQVQQEKFDLAIQMQGNGSIINPMIELFGAKHTAGFTIEGHYAPDNGLFMEYPDYGPEIERHILLMQHLGIKAQGTDLEFPLSVEDYNSLDELQLGIEPKKYVCVHPGSRGSWRQWPVKYFAALADYCVEQGYKAVITGTKDESDLVEGVISNMRHEAINSAGTTTMGAVGALIQNAAMLISNCTGVSHIASAFKTPSIVISMDGEPQRWGPMDKRVHRTINWLQSPDFHLVFRETVELVSLAD
ncbi:glycosyltransferase family 9 protein [Mucilaginibacter limnophilus]|uniref:Glycosyltransferase family 9 protein n=1 Tax=Mucilaginibacter limnophilus TaxID=1932778 RepID=A0A437MI40_9SPHI|nr:glycosyltransferase family 9 protein [Mucilaginibacter limnophilus]RVT97293.1 glycosyltransferase family 9 protein [Mucilaginibacter limnophilus]